jgi:hypothetical protein
VKSIIEQREQCYICGTVLSLEKHHIFYGTANRRKSEQYGLTVLLCPEHHRGTFGVHGACGHELDKRLKMLGQRQFERIYSRDKFMQEFGKNYL